MVLWDSFGLCRGHYRFVLAKQCSNKHPINGKPAVLAGLCHLSSRRALVLKGFAVLPWYKSKVSNPQGHLCTLDVPVSPASPKNNPCPLPRPRPFYDQLRGPRVSRPWAGTARSARGLFSGPAICLPSGKLT